MQDFTKNYIKWISDFTKEQFDEVIEMYIREVWRIEDIVFTDGTNDGGNDIRIFEDNKKLKIQIQVTVQETGLEGKVTKDLVKAQSNVEKFAYQNRLYFFYSHSISEDKINDLELLSNRDYEIDLQIIDVKKISAAAKRYPDLANVIHKIYGLGEVKPTILSEEDRILYDFISFGSNTIEIKNQIITSFIVHKIYENGSLNKKKLIDFCSNHFGNKETALLEKLFTSLKSRRVIIEEEDGLFVLNEEESQRISNVKAQFNFQEQELIGEIRTLLGKFKIDTDRSLAIVEKLRQLFESNFNIDKLEISDSAYKLEEDNNIEALTVFYKYVRSLCSSNSSKAKLLTKRLLETCKENDILQKLGAGKLFSSFNDPEIIRNYVNQSERYVFLDTQVVLHALCFYFQDSNYNNFFYQATKETLGLPKRYKGLHFKLFENYVNEVAYHFKEALMLIPFEEAGLINGLGGSNNIFFNYYTFLNDSQQLDDDINSFASFLKHGFEFKESDAFHKNFFSIAFGIIKERLNNLGISIFNDQYSIEYFDESKNVIKECLREKDRTRPDATLNNDSNMLAILFDENIAVNEPVFLSWDQRLFCARRKFYNLFRGSRLWHWFTPNQFVNHISILNFNINSSTITREVISTFDENYNFYQKTKSLLDTISKLLNVKSETGRKYVQKIKEFKREYIFAVDREYDNNEEYVEEKTYPIEEVIMDLSKHYTFSTNNYTLEQFKLLFTVDELFEKVIAYFEEQITFYMKYHSRNEKSILKMDMLIKEALEIKIGKAKLTKPNR